jgi:hypothetical protein
MVGGEGVSPRKEIRIQKEILFIIFVFLLVNSSVDMTLNISSYFLGVLPCPGLNSCEWKERGARLILTSFVNHIDYRLQTLRYQQLVDK